MPPAGGALARPTSSRVGRVKAGHPSRLGAPGQATRHSAALTLTFFLGWGGAFADLRRYTSLNCPYRHLYSAWNAPTPACAPLNCSHRHLYAVRNDPKSADLGAENKTKTHKHANAYFVDKRSWQFPRKRPAELSFGRQNYLLGEETHLRRPQFWAT